MDDFAAYLVVVVAFIDVVGALTFRPHRRTAELNRDRPGWIEQQMGLRGRQEVTRALQNGHPIQAVAIVRRQTDASLTEAKAIVGAIERDSTRRVPQRD